MSRRSLVKTIGLFGAILSVSIFFMNGYATSLGLPSSIGENLISVLPSALIMILGMVTVASTRRESAMVVGGVICVGIGGAMFVEDMNTIGLISAGTSLPQIQAVIIGCSVIIGGLVYVSN